VVVLVSVNSGLRELSDGRQRQPIFSVAIVIIYCNVFYVTEVNLHTAAHFYLTEPHDSKLETKVIIGTELSQVPTILVITHNKYVGTLPDRASGVRVGVRETPPTM
jgi:hypothetical protein